MGERMKWRLAGVFSGVVMLSGATAAPAVAQEGWRFAVTPYLWMSGIKGGVTPPGPSGPIDVDVGFKDIFKSLDGLPVIAAAEARYGRIGMVADLMYLPQAARIDTRNLLFNDGKAKMSTTMAAFTGFYRVSDEAALTADIGVGLRLWSVHQKVRLNAGLLPAASARLDKTFVDPILAARVTLGLSERWSVTGYLDVGGFDIGATRITWQLLGTVNYRAAEWVDLRLGWRHIGVERSKVDLQLTGPIAGATFRF